MPTPRANESRDDFVSRCIPVVLEDGTAADRKQAVAVCNSMWEDRNKMGNQITINITDGEVEEAEPAEDKATWTTAFVNDLPDGSFLYVEPGGEKDGEGRTTPRSLRHFPYKDAAGKVDLPHLRNAIARIPQANIPADKKRSLQERARRLLSETNKEDEGWFESLVERVKAALRPVERPEPREGFMLWKEEDGQYRWLARYSNNLRDQDDPPEIISTASHKAFVDAVDKGEAEYPELWLWHRPEWKWGQATWLAYDDSGFALAAGTVDRGKEKLALQVASIPADQLRVSHGMPITSIKRDPDDPSVIVQHVTREISPLPAWAAANQHTGFYILQEVEQPMALPKDKRDRLVDEWGLPEDLLGQLEEANAEEAKAAQEAGVESKEKEAEPDVDQPVEEQPTEDKDADPEPVADEQPEPAVDEPPAAEPVYRQELAEAMSALGQAFQALNEQVNALAGQVKELKESKAVEEEESLVDIFQRAAGHPAARLDGRTSQAKDRPRETKPQQEAVVNTGNPMADDIVNQIVTGSWLDAFRQTQQ